VPTSTPTYACPAISGQTVSDQYGNQFEVQCGADTTAGNYAVDTATGSWNDCFSFCHSENVGNTCTGFTYVGTANGAGPGQCYIKNGAASQAGTQSFVPANGDASAFVGAIMVRYHNAAGDTIPGSSASSASITFYPTTTTTATTSSSSTSMPASTTSSSRSSTSSPAITTTTTTTTTTSHSSTISSTSTSRYLALASPTPCDFGDPVGTRQDDSYCNINLDFPLQIYTQSSPAVFASTNGYISIVYGQSQYQTEALPDSHIPNSTVAPWLDDLVINAWPAVSPRQGIWYQANSTGVTFEYYVGRYQGNATYHFTVSYSQANAGVFVYTYYATGDGDNGSNAAVGAQGRKSIPSD